MEQPICHHDETYRAGAIWEICSQCGKKWADDVNPRQKWKLVPTEPTEAMLAEIHLVEEFTLKAMIVRYKAMLDVAPEPLIKGHQIE
jgi:hypothetical protein